MHHTLTPLNLRLTVDYRVLYSIPQAYAYGAERLLPLKCLRKVAAGVRHACKRLRYGDDAEAARLMRQLKMATCLSMYEECAKRLDVIQDNEGWKEEDHTPEPEYKPLLLRKRIDDMYQALDTEDPTQMARCIRISVERSVGGIDLLRLYKHCWWETKYLINEFITAACGTVEAYVQIKCREDAPPSEAEDGIQTLCHNLLLHGKSALCLSGGALMGMKHIGVVKCLWESDLLPDNISGASAGSIVAAIVCTSTDHEMKQRLECFPTSNLACFDPPGTSLHGWIRNRLHRLLTTGTFFDPQYLKRVVKDEWLHEITFQEAFRKTGRCLNIVVSDMESSQPVVLNHENAPDVFVWSAVCASCAVPYVFPPATIYQKDPMTGKTTVWRNAMNQYVDGSVYADIPIVQLTEGLSVGYLIVSQVNPHVRLFLRAEEEFCGRPLLTPKRRYSVLHLLKSGCLSLANTILMDMLWFWGPLTNQTYTADANVLPRIDWSDYLTMMMNPSPEFMRQSTFLGEQATWPKMPRLQNSVAIEKALKHGVRDLKKRIELGPRRRLSRGRSYRGRSPQPQFLQRDSSEYRRQRSTSSDNRVNSMNNATLPFRRNRSDGDLTIALLAMTHASLSPQVPPSLSPQAGVGDKTSRGFTMTRSAEDIRGRQ